MHNSERKKPFNNCSWLLIVFQHIYCGLIFYINIDEHFVLTDQLVKNINTSYIEIRIISTWSGDHLIGFVWRISQPFLLWKDYLLCTWSAGWMVIPESSRNGGRHPKPPEDVSWGLKLSPNEGIWNIRQSLGRYQRKKESSSGVV